MKIWARVVVAWTLLALVAGLVLFFVFNRPINITDHGPVARQVPGRVVVAGQRLPVTLRVIPEALPACDASTTVPVDIALLLDRSASMGGQPLEEAKQAIQTLAGGLDPQFHRLALIPFNSAAQVASPLTASTSQVLAAAEQLEADGGTGIDQALRVGSQVLAGSRALGRQGTLILLSDGGGDLASTAREASQARAAGLGIVAVGLRGDEFDEKVLRAVAGQSEPIILDDPADLGAVFAQLADEVTNPLVTGLSIQEHYNARAFELADPVLRAAAGNPGVFQWEVPMVALTEASRSYTLRARRIGLHELSPGGQASMIDCLGNPLLSPVPAGPLVLVLLPLPWLFGLWLLPLLLLLAAFLLRPRRRKEPEYLNPDDYPDFVAASYPLPGVQDLREVEDRDDPEPRRGDPHGCPHVLILGAGDAGRWVLTAVKHNLIKRYGQMPDKVRLLAVDFRAPGRDIQPVTIDGVELKEGAELQQLSPDFDKWQGSDSMPWQGSHKLDKAGRVRGRMALAIDLEQGAGPKGSPLWRSLADAKKGLDKPAVYVVASLGDEAGSGMAFDLCELARLAGEGRQVVPFRRTLLLGLPSALGRGSTDTERRNREGLAGLRELRRLFFAGSRHPWSAVYGETEERPFDACYLFDGYLQVAQDTTVSADTEAPEVDLRSRPEEAGPLSVIADWLSGAVDPQIYPSHSEQLLAAERRIREDAGSLDRSLYGAIGACVLSLPVDLQRSHAQWQLIEQAVAQPTTMAAASTGDAVSFLRGKSPAGDMANHHVMMAWMAELSSEPWRQDGLAGPSFFVQMRRKAGQVFEYALAEWLTADMNRSKGHALASSSAFLHVLRARLQLAKRELNNLTLPSDRDRDAWQRWVEACLQTVERAERDLKAWQAELKTLQEESQGKARSYHKQLQRWRSTRTGRLTEEALGGIGISAEMRAELRLKAARMHERLFWAWHVGAGQPQLHMITLPLAFDATADSIALSDLIGRNGYRSSADKQAVVDWLTIAATYHTRFILQAAENNMSIRLGQIPRREVVSLLARASSPLLRYDEAEVKRIFSAIHSKDAINVEIWRVLSVGNTELGGALTQDLNEPRTAVRSTDDPYTFSLLSLARPIPLGAIKSQTELAQAVSTPQPDDQIFLAERALVAWEKRVLNMAYPDPFELGPWQGIGGRPFERRSSGPLFHPRFGAIIGDGQRAELFARAILCGLIWKDTEAWSSNLDNREVRLGPSAEIALESFCAAPDGRDHGDPLGKYHIDSSLEWLERAIATCYKEATDDLLDRFRECLTEGPIGDLRNSKDPVERGLWNLLRMVAEETA